MFNIKAIFPQRAFNFSINYNWIKNNRLGIFSFIFTFSIILSFIGITLSRNAAIRSIKNEIEITIKKLNEIGIDIAYSNIEFNNIFTYPLISIQNLQLYNLEGKNLWNISFSEIKGNTSLFNTNNIKMQFSENAKIRINDKEFPINIANGELRIKTNKKQELNALKLNINDINIKNLAKINSLSGEMQKINSAMQAPVILPTIEANIEAKNISLNGLLNYPLTSQIERIFIRSNVIGTFPSSTTFLLSSENWLRSGGFIEIPSFLINWDPLLMVGRGTINFDEKLTPKIQLQTSSKALHELLQDLLKIGFIEKKGTFVANVLLKAKSFKLKKEDKYLTVTTPITYSDGKLSIENVMVKTIQ